MKKSLFVIAIVGMSIGACNNPGNNEKQEESTNNTNETTKLEEINAKGLLGAYLKLKDALVATNRAEAATAAEMLIQSAREEEYSNTDELIERCTQIARSKSVDVQRAEFETISDMLYEYFKEQKTDIDLYRQYCPMAFNNKGAYWISAHKEIRNPYFGDKMLKCGTIEEEL